MSRQDDRSDATQNALKEACRMLVVEGGFDQATTTDIARMANCSRGALYHHFGDKKTLFVESAKDLQEGLHARLIALADQEMDAYAAMRAMMHGYVEGASTHAFYAMVMRAPFEDPSLDEQISALVSLLEEGIIAIKPVAQDEAHLLAHMLLGALQGAVRVKIKMRDEAKAILYTKQMDQMAEALFFPSH